MEIERGCEKEREGSLVPIFSFLTFKIMRMSLGWVGFCSQVLALWEKRSWLIFELKREFYIEFEVLLMIGFLALE